MTTSVATSTFDLDGALECLDFSLETGIPHIAILMCTYNGDRFLIEQLASFERQTHHNWTVIVSDDGSQDETLKILQTHSSNWGANRLKVVSGPKRGFVANFLSLTSRKDIQANFYAWSDQDDIWREDKLQKALDWLQTIPEQTPALYCGRTELICEAGTTIGFSPNFSRPPHFSNALVQSIGGGNTMVFNQAARALLQEAGDNLTVPSHDWWAYQLISGAGGIIHYDSEPKVLYRQHNGNLVGSNSNWPARIRRLNMVFKGRYYEWNAQNIRALETMHHRLSQEHKESLTNFKKARNQNIFGRLLGIWQAGLYRQTLLGNLGLTIATLLKKV